MKEVGAVSKCGVGEKAKNREVGKKPPKIRRWVKKPKKGRWVLFENYW